jgi:inorganic triphosphatase YgiF
MLARNPVSAVQELELKFQLGSGAVDALRRSALPPGTGEIVSLRATYFDTPDHRLRDGGFSLRVRREGARHVQTLKHRGAGGLFERDEWESEIEGPELDRALLAGTPIADLAAHATLAPAFTIEVERLLQVREHGGARIEISLDLGRILAAGREEPVAELELERLDGDGAALFDLARALQAQAPLTPLFESKAERGYRLAGHDGVAALKARAAPLVADTPVGEAFQRVTREALVQIAGNARLLPRSRSADVLHQLRVGLRRLRAGLVVFRGILDADGLAFARRESRWLAGELAEARDLDVFMQLASAQDEIEESPGRVALFATLRRAQAEAYDRALAAISSERFRRLLLDLGAWIEIGGWRTASRTAALRDGPCDRFAGPVLDRLAAGVARRARRFSKLDIEARHDLRKQVKKLRYGSAFFAATWPEHPRRKARYRLALKALQDHLGAINDLSVAAGVANRMAPRGARDLAFAAGQEAGRLDRASQDARATAHKALKAFRRNRPFWPSRKRRNRDLNHSASRSLTSETP